jgi:predicted nucleic acid-binding protein
LLENNYILDLTIYEVGNAIWRMHALLKKLSEEDVSSLMSVTADLTKRMEKMSILGLNLLQTIELAVREKITFYDAAYVTASKMKRLVLVTDDMTLARVASKHVKTKRTGELMAQS